MALSLCPQLTRTNRWKRETKRRWLDARGLFLMLCLFATLSRVTGCPIGLQNPACGSLLPKHAVTKGYWVCTGGIIPQTDQAKPEPSVYYQPQPSNANFDISINQTYYTDLDYIIRANVSGPADGRLDINQFACKAVRDGTDDYTIGKTAINTIRLTARRSQCGLTFEEADEVVVPVKARWNSKFTKFHVVWNVSNTARHDVRIRCVLVHSYDKFYVLTSELIRYGSTTSPSAPSQPPAKHPVEIDLSECGSSKTCYRSPDDCTSTASCSFVFTHQRVGNDLLLEISGNASGWVGVGFNQQQFMDRADVIGCAVDLKSRLFVKNTYNYYYPTMRKRFNQLKMADWPHYGILDSNISFTDGRISCRVKRPISVRLATAKNLSENLFIMFGKSDTPSPRKKPLPKHATTPVITSSFRSLLGSAKNYNLHGGEIPLPAQESPTNGERTVNGGTTDNGEHIVNGGTTDNSERTVNGDTTDNDERTVNGGTTDNSEGIIQKDSSSDGVHLRSNVFSMTLVFTFVVFIKD